MCNLSMGIYDKGVEQGMAQGALEMLFNLVKEGLLTVAVAAQQADMEQAVFEQKYSSFVQKQVNYVRTILH